MKSTLLSSYSNFGKYTATNYEQEQTSTAFSSITLKQNYTHQRPFIDCKFDIPGNRLYLLDNKGTLIHLNLSDNSFSTLKSQKVKDFTIDGNNSLSLLYVTPCSQLFRVSFDKKKPIKIMNLNMSRILAFERNYLREMLLVLDYKLLFLCDLANTSKIKSLKAGYNQTFTNACFASNNRFIILASKNIQIKILQIVDLKPIHEIKLPYPVDNLKIQVSYDSKKIAIYGNSQIIFFINISDKMEFSYEIIQIPFLKSIYQLKYTYQNEIIFLGNDQILYAVSPTDLTKAIPIFNEDYHVRLMGFDVSLDCKKMAVVSNRTVYGFKFSKGLRAAIEAKQTYKAIEFRENGFNEICFESQKAPHEESGKEKQGNYQYQDEDQEQDEEDSSDLQPSIINMQHMKRVENLPKVHDSTEDPLNPLISEINENGIYKRQKAHLNQIFNYVISNFRHITLGQGQNFVDTITKLYLLTGKNGSQCLNLCSLIFHNVSTQIDKFEHYAFVFCPQIISIIQKRFSCSFMDFFKEKIATLFLNYYKEDEKIKLINWLITQLEFPETLPLLLISTLQEVVRLIEEREEDWRQLIKPLNCLVSFSKVVDRLERTKEDSRFGNMLNKKKISEYHVPQCDILPPAYHPESEIYENNLERLIMKQQQIKTALNRFQIEKPIH